MFQSKNDIDKSELFKNQREEKSHTGKSIKITFSHGQADRMARKLSATKIKLSHWSTDHSTQL